MIYKLSSIAEIDLRRIYSFGIFKFGLNQADIYYDKFIETFKLITKSPYAFPIETVNQIDYHKCVCGSDVIYYRIMTDYVEISTIIGFQDFQNFE